MDVSSATNDAVQVEQLKVEKAVEANNAAGNGNELVNPNGGQVGNNVNLGNPNAGELKLNPNGDNKLDDNPVEFKPPNFLKGNK